MLADIALRTSVKSGCRWEVLRTDHFATAKVQSRYRVKKKAQTTEKKSEDKTTFGLVGAFISTQRVLYDHMMGTAEEQPNRQRNSRI